MNYTTYDTASHPSRPESSKILVYKINFTMFILTLQFLKQRTTQWQHEYQVGLMFIRAIFVIFIVCSWVIVTVPWHLYLIVQGTLRNCLMLMYFIVQAPYLILQLLYVTSRSYYTVRMGGMGFVSKTDEPTRSGSNTYQIRYWPYTTSNGLVSMPHRKKKLVHKNEQHTLRIRKTIFLTAYFVPNCSSSLLIGTLNKTPLNFSLQ